VSVFDEYLSAPQILAKKNGKRFIHVHRFILGNLFGATQRGKGKIKIKDKRFQLPN